MQYGCKDNLNQAENTSLNIQIQYLFNNRCHSTMLALGKVYTQENILFLVSKLSIT